MILGEDETFNLTIQLRRIRTRRAINQKYFSDTSSLKQTRSRADMQDSTCRKYLSYPRIQNNPTADYVPYPYLTILNYTTHGRLGISTTGVERGTIYAKNAPTTL